MIYRRSTAIFIMGVLFLFSLLGKSTAGTMKIAARGRHTIALKSDGTIWTWGINTHGQLGDGTVFTRPNPTDIGTPSVWLKSWRKIAAGYDHSVAIGYDDTLWAWGNNQYGQLGDGTRINRSGPVRIGIDSDWVAIAAGGFHTVALKANGTLWAWGSNREGQLGDGTTSNRFAPVRIGSDNDWTAIAAGKSHTVALKSDGSAWAWGDNSKGQLGDYTNMDRLIPKKVQLMWCVKIAAGAEHTVLIESNGQVSTWGSNSCGQLGDGEYDNRNYPQHVAYLSEVAAGADYTIGFEANGVLQAWGFNSNGQLGNPTSINKIFLPTVIDTCHCWVKVTAGGRHTVALQSNGTLWAWGYNSHGQLGDGTTIDRDHPVQIVK